MIHAATVNSSYFIQVRKSRVAFSIKKDIFLLRASLEFNPWQLGQSQWKEIAEKMGGDFKESFTTKTVQKRVELLVDKYKKKELKITTGTEEETSERGYLLETIIGIQEEEDAAINVELNAEVEVDIDEADDDTLMHQNDEDPTANARNIAKERRLERAEADKERDSYVDEAPGPSSSRCGRSRLTLEDEVLLEKQKHELFIDKEKLGIEKQRLALEEQREKRLKEESERRDELTRSQMQMQTTTLELLQKVLEKIN